MPKPLCRSQRLTILALSLSLVYPPSLFAAQESKYRPTPTASSGGVSQSAAVTKTSESPASNKVRVRVPCDNPKSPIRVIETEVVSFDEKGAPAVDRRAVAAQAGHDCKVGGRLEIEQTEEQKKAATAAQRKAWLRKGQAIAAVVLQAKGHKGAAQALTGYLGVTSLLDKSASPEEQARALKVMAGALVGGDGAAQALQEYVAAKGESSTTYAAVIDRQQATELAAAQTASRQVEQVPIRSKDKNQETWASIRSGRTTATSRDAVAASVKYPASAKAYEGMIENAAAKYGVDPDILRAMATVESRFNPNAVSNVGARGLVQIMPGTARDLGFTPEQMFNPQLNLYAAAKYVAQMQRYKYVGNNLSLISAAYNAGPGNVRKYGGIPPFKETQNHVRKVNAVYYALKARREKGLG